MKHTMPIDAYVAKYVLEAFVTIAAKRGLSLDNLLVESVTTGYNDQISTSFKFKDGNPTSAVVDLDVSPESKWGAVSVENDTHEISLGEGVSSPIISLYLNSDVITGNSFLYEGKVTIALVAEELYNFLTGSNQLITSKTTPEEVSQIVNKLLYER